MWSLGAIQMEWKTAWYGKSALALRGADKRQHTYPLSPSLYVVSSTPISFALKGLILLGPTLHLQWPNLNYFNWHFN